MRIFFTSLLLVSVQSFVSSQDADQDVVNWVQNIYKNASQDKPDESDIDLSPASENDNDPACLLENSNRKGICVLYYLCDPNSRTLIIDGTSLIDIRQRNCPHYLDVCCEQNKIIDVESQDVESFIPEQSVPDKLPASTSATLTPTSTPKPSATSRPVPTKEITCGWSNPLTYIFPPVNKTEDRLYADFGEFPWMVAVMLKRRNSQVWRQDDYLGGGALIHPAVVMTVAHKVNNLTNAIKCRAGEWDTQTTKEQFPFQERDVKEVIVHPDYFRPSVYNDVALLILERQFDLQNAPHIGFACLGQALPPPSTTCFSMGWGKDFNKKNTYAVALKKIRMNLIGSDDCQNLLRTNSRLGPYFELHESLTCAGGVARVDTCKGDGGSPLVCPVPSSHGNTRYVVYGMVAYGLGKCGQKDVPGVYVKVPQVYEWVQQQMQERGYGALERP